MKWEIESVTDDEGPTMTVRVLITDNEGNKFVDQRNLPDGSTKEDIAAMCDELCRIHDKPDKKDLSSMVGMKSGY